MDDGLLLSPFMETGTHGKNTLLNGPLAQIVALTCHANALLQGYASIRFFPENSTCDFCDSISFVKPERSFTGKMRESPLAPTPDLWLARLAELDAKGVRLGRTAQNRTGTPDRMLAGFAGGGGTWTMEVLFPGEKIEFWQARWDVWNREAPDQRIWKVIYVLVSAGSKAEGTALDLTDVEKQLVHSLQAIRSFSSSKHGCDGFTRLFSEALDILTGSAGVPGACYQDLAPAGFLPEKARVLLDACQRAWVFGGMGSWNDMGFKSEEQKRYETVSEALFKALNEAILAAVHSGAPW